MINVLVPITIYKKKYEKLLTELGERGDVNLFVGVVSKVKQEITYIPDEMVYVYDESADKESIINALSSQMEEGDVVILRQPISVREFDEMISKDENVVTADVKRGRISNFFFRIWQRILKMFIGVNLYEGNTAAIYFSENLFPILIESGNLSFASRVDRWIGVEKTTADVKVEKEKYQADPKTIFKYCLIADIALLIAALVTTFVCIFTNVGIILGLLLFCIDGICFALILENFMKRGI